MQVISTVAEMQQVARRARQLGQTIGCVPTMGALHAGHGSLIAASAAVHAVTVTSVFVNPTQFGPTEDFDSYPRMLDADIATIERCGGTHVFAPSIAEMYPGGYTTKIRLDGVTEVLEGAHRPGHFDGVATVVCKLLMAMQPDEAFFGQKDYQQTLVVRRLVEDLLIPVTMTVAPTVREANGLAMSSRNAYLSAEERHRAAVLYRALSSAADIVTAADQDVSRHAIEDAMLRELHTVEDFSVGYAVAVDADTLLPADTYHPGDRLALLIAGTLGTTRLIDNVLVTV
jgi:pantoate--beta-alanine ligase